jgi:hypothetical protein
MRRRVGRTWRGSATGEGFVAARLLDEIKEKPEATPKAVRSLHSSQAKQDHDQEVEFRGGRLVVDPASCAGDLGAAKQRRFGKGGCGAPQPSNTLCNTLPEASDRRVSCLLFMFD